MSFPSALGTGPSGGLRFAQTRGRIQGGAQTGLNYPSPFFDVAHTYLPATLKQLFRWCRYYFLTNPLINATVFKLSEYPITDVIIDHEDPAVAKKWTEHLQDVHRYRSFQVEVGLDYHTYGVAFISLSFPFKKYLQCTSCGYKEQACLIREHWVFTNNQFRLSCPKCHTTADSIPKDFYIKDPAAIKLVRWNPEDMEVEYNDLTGEHTFYYTIPTTVRNDIVTGKKTVVEKIPQIFIQAVRERKGVIFTQESMFQFKRPSLAGQDRGWGIPLLLPVLKDTFYLQIMKKAQEAILLEHVVPLRVLFPQAGSGSSDPYVSINLVDWRDHIASEIGRWRMDSQYIPILPLPIGNQTIGGDGKALLLVQEIQAWSDQIITGMGVPLEFLRGGMSYAGTNVSMRMLENAFLGYIQRHKALCKFVIRGIASFMQWPEVNARFKPFKMADDLQRKAYLFQLNQAQKISDTTLLNDADLSIGDENEIMIRESDHRVAAMKKQQLAMAEIQGEAQMIMMKFQAKAQQTQQQAMMAPQAPGEPGEMGAPGAGDEGVPVPPELQVQGPGGETVEGAPPAQQGADPMAGTQSPLNQQQQLQAGQPAIDLPSMASMWASQIQAMDPSNQKLALENLRMQSPPLADMVQQILSSQQTQQIAPGVDMRPLSEKLPPRREASPI